MIGPARAARIGWPMHREAGTMAAPVIYGPAISTYVRTVRLALEEKGVPYELVELDFMRGEHKEAAHLARHPFGRVPAFAHDGFDLYETGAITRYIDAALPGPSLTPAEPRAVARMQQAICIVDAYAYGAMISAIFMQRVVTPLLGGSVDEAKIAAAVPTAELSLEAIEDVMGGQPWLAGDALSLADLHLAPVIAYFRQTPEGGQLLASRGRLQRWWEGLAGRPSMQRTRPQLG